MCAGKDFDRFRELTITSAAAVMIPVATDDLGENMRVTRVRLRSRCRVSLSVAGGLDRIDRIDRIAGHNQCLHPPTPVRLDPDDHSLWLIALIEVRTDQYVQLRETDDTFRQSPTNKNRALPVLQLDIVMGFSPIISKEQHVPTPLFTPSSSSGGSSHRSNGSVLTAHHPSSRHASSRVGRGTI